MNDNVTSILDSMNLTEQEADTQLLPVEYIGIDPRLKRLSYSSCTTLHSCPRKYQLYKLKTLANPTDNTIQEITFSYGHVVGQGIQDVLEHRSEQEIFMRAFMLWSMDLLLEDERANKGFFSALIAIKKFIAMRERGYLEDYELLSYNGKPAVELGFRILMQDDYEYRGFVDAVLIHKTTGQILVLECKTTKYKVVNPAQFKNSAQAIGYSIVLDFIKPGASAYTVLYLVYSSGSCEYKELPFEKSYLQRAHWLRNLMIDKQKVDLYSSYKDAFPMHGESCFSYFRDCEYLGVCNLDTSHIAKPYTQKDVEEMEEDKKKYHFTASFEDLIAIQLEKEI